VSQCPVSEGDNVTIGCYAQYDWLSQLLQYNPIVSLNASLQFDGYPETLDGPQTPEVPPPTTSPPKSQLLKTTYHIPDARGSISVTCRVTFVFERSTAYSGRNTFASNSLEYTSTVKLTVNCEYSFYIVELLQARHITSNHSRIQGRPSTPSPPNKKIKKQDTDLSPRLVRHSLIEPTYFLLNFIAHAYAARRMRTL